MWETPQMGKSARSKILINRRNSCLPFAEINRLRAILMGCVTLILDRPIMTRTVIYAWPVSVSSARSATRRIQAKRCTLESSSSFRWERINKICPFCLFSFRTINHIIQFDNKPNLNCGIYVDCSYLCQPANLYLFQQIKMLQH